MNIIRSLFASCVFFAMLPAALAHGGGPHLMGTVKSVDDKSIVVTGVDGKEVTVTIDEKSSVNLNGKRATTKDLKIGERVVVHTRKSDAGLVAVMIKGGKMVDKDHGHHMEHGDEQPTK